MLTIKFCSFLQLWNVASGQITKTLEGHWAGVNCVTFSPDGSLIAVSHGTSPYIGVYPWGSGFGTKYSDPSTLPAGTGRGVAFSPV